MNNQGYLFHFHTCSSRHNKDDYFRIGKSIDIELYFVSIANSKYRR